MKNSSRRDATLVIFFGERLTFGFSSDSPIRCMEGSDITYQPFGTDFDGFYDWLRLDGRVVGVRQNSHTGDAFLSQLPKHAYLSLGMYSDLEVYFTDVRSYDQQDSADQCFAYNEFWSSEDGRFALALDLGALTDVERNQIKGLAVPRESLKTSSKLPT